MSVLNRINNAVVGSKGVVKQIGWIGDSIYIANYFGKTGYGTSNQKYSFASIVSSFYGAFSNNQAESGRILSSFLPFLSGSVSTAVAQFDGQWLNDNGNWHWWNPSANSWISVNDVGTSVIRNGTSVSKLTNLLSNSSVRHIFICQSGVNDNRSNLDSDAGDAGAHGSYHYSLLLNEIINRIQIANKIAIIISGTTAAHPDFHGTPKDLRQEEIGRYCEAARHSAIEKNVQCCDVGLRLNLELALGRVDILCRNSQNKPSDVTQKDWDAYLAKTGDSNASTNPYRSFDESEDFLHVNDSIRASYFHNLHPNGFGHYLIANEILKFIGENGLR